MNLPNKITMGRIFLAIIILLLLVFPFYLIGFEFPKYIVFGKIAVDLKYIIAGILFIIASISDFVDGQIARKRNLVTDFGKAMDAVADKMLVNGVLIVLGANGFVPLIVPVIIITRDIFVDAVKMVAGSKGNVVAAGFTGKLKTVFMMSGITLVLFYNIPFELINIKLGDVLIVLATVLSLISAWEYYSQNKKFFSEK